MPGLEWVIEAHGCDTRTLVSQPALSGLFAAIIADMELHPVAPGSWHQFPGAGGITGLQLLQESHLACHTFPEFGSMCLNIFCCRPRPRADFETLLAKSIGARSVSVRCIDRNFDSSEPA